MATINVHNKGDIVRVTGTLATAAGAVIDPTAVTVTIKAPDGTVTTPAPVHSGTGVYYVDVTPNQPGDWYYKFVSTGTGQAEDEGMFRVRASAI